MLKEFKKLMKYYLEITVFALPILVYVFDYLFEFGYAFFFRIPISIIQINLFQAIPIVVFCSVSFIILIYYVYDVIKMVFVVFVELFTSYKTSRIRTFLFLPLILGTFLYSLCYLLSAEFIFWFICTGIIISSSMVYSSKALKDSNNSNEELSENSDRNIENNKEKSDNACDKERMIDYQLICVILALLAIYSYAFGFWWASTSKKFLTVNISDKEYVVLRQYGDNFICSPLNRINKTTNNTFLFIKAGEKDDIARNTFIYEEIGKLQVTGD